MARFITGQLAVTGSRQQLTSNTLKVESLLLKAHPENNDEIYFGDSTVTTATGFALSAGEEFRFDPSNGPLNLTPLPSEIYVIGSGTGYTIFWIATRR